MYILLIFPVTFLKSLSCFNLLKIVENSLYKAIVLNAYFKGNYWLIEANFESQIVFLSHPSEIKKGTEIRLSFQF